jgi:hypothetical protein
LCATGNAGIYTANHKWVDVNCFVCVIGSTDNNVRCGGGVYPVSLAAEKLHQVELGMKHG